MFVSDRRLWLTVDRSEVVEEGDPRAAFLLVGAGCQLEASIARQYGLLPSFDESAISPSDTASASDPKSEADSKAIEAPPENKAIWPAANKRVKGRKTTRR